MQLTLPARAENIAIVRHALGAFGEAFAVDAQVLSDIRLAVTEACTNVVVHAYPGGVEGPLEVLASLTEQELNVTVRDEGRGIACGQDSPGLGLGLPLIASLADSVHLGRDERQRTEVQMVFSLSEEPPSEPRSADRDSSTNHNDGQPVAETPASPQAPTPPITS
jgi:serine/threonine-protein kinase RsbW